MELRLLREIVDSLSETGNGQDEPGISCHARRKGSLENTGVVSKGHQNQPD